MFQAQNRETINSTWKAAVAFEIIMTMSVTRPCVSYSVQDQDQTDFLVSDRSCPKTDGLRPHHWWNMLLPMCYHNKCRRSRFGHRSQKCGDAGAPPLGMGRGWPHRNMLLLHLRYHAKFGHSSSNDTVGKSWPLMSCHSRSLELTRIVWPPMISY